MKFLYKIVLSFSVFFLSLVSLKGQESGTTVKGKVLDSKSGLAIEFASVALLEKATKKPITGTTADLEGAFEIQTAAKTFVVEVSSIGFDNKLIKDYSIKDGVIDLGEIKLTENNMLLEEVVIRAEKSQTEFELDKRVFNVGKDLSTTGASALEILNNVPSVNVSIEGEISLRGSGGVQILINGKPSVMASGEGNALGTITADMIEKIEVITNPSAKYDAEGTSGIINIIIKKDERKGFNGSVSLNTGIPDSHSIGISLNRRTEKFNLFSQLGAGYRSLPNKMENINQDLINNEIINSKGTEYRNETFYNFILGTDYHLNEYNVFTLSGNFAYEIEDGPSRTDFSLLDAQNQVVSEWYREEATEANNPKYQYDFQYKRDFKDHKDHTLLASAVGSFFGKDQSSQFGNTYTFGTGNLNDQQTRTNFKEAENLFKVDYTHPFSEAFTWELGSQYVINDVSNDYSVSDQIDGVYVENAALTNLFEYNQKVFAVYSTGAYEGEKWGVKLGLRMESTDLNTYLATTDVSNTQKYNNLFPSLHTTLKVSKEFSVQAGYSSRIFRPRLWDLNPFFNIRNNFNVRTGNPDLLPEYTDSYELTAIYLLDKLSLNGAIYYRLTDDVVERISTFEDGVTYTKPTNIGTNKSTGLEINGKLTAAKWLTFNGDFNYSMFKREGSLEAVLFDFSADQWSTRLNAKIGLPKDIDMEVSGNYRSKVRTLQGEQSHQVYADFGIRKKILKGRGVVNLSVRDVLASRIGKSETVQPEFYVYSSRQRGRFIALGFSYGFGKGEAMEYSGARRRF
ncbi:outer membrane beta-barrel family protein [uncultured Arcticibacterium sp.]|uniref:outer membrane beta-barrel family protein n=1 Tax=uncultured Arcticibacterium sp. TaxID=2173042 RepID=UPI0030F68A0D